MHEFDARRRSAERRAMLDAMYGGMATKDGNEMAPYAPLHTATHGAKTQSIRSHRNTV